MGKYKKLGKNMLSLTIGNFASKILSFLFVPFYTAVLSTSEYGTADLITTTVNLLFPFFSCIICESMMRFALNEEEDKDRVFQVGITVWGVGFIILLAFSPILLLFNALKNYYWLTILYYLAYSINTTIGYYIRGCEKVALYSVSGIVSTIITIGCNLLFLLVLKTGVEGYVLSTIIANLVSSLIMIKWSGVHLDLLFQKDFDRNLLAKMMKYSLPMIPNSASWWISNSSDKYILLFFAGVSVNGIYSVAYKIPTIVSIVTSIFATAWKLSAVEKFGTSESKNFYSEIYGLYITLTVCIASGLLTINKPLSHFLYSKEFYQAWHFVPILLVAAVVHAYCEFFGTLYTSAMKTKMLFYSTIAGAITNILLNFLLIPRLAALGAAIATLLSYMTVFLVRMIHSSTIMKLNYDYFSDICCFCLLAIQVIIASISLKYEWLISLTLFFMIILVRRKNIRMLAAILTKKHNNN